MEELAQASKVASAALLEHSPVGLCVACGPDGDPHCVFVNRKYRYLTETVKRQLARANSRSEDAIQRSALAYSTDTSVEEQLRERFLHWLYDETQDPLAQRA